MRSRKLFNYIGEVYNILLDEKRDRYINGCFQSAESCPDNGWHSWISLKEWEVNGKIFINLVGSNAWTLKDDSILFKFDTETQKLTSKRGGDTKKDLLTNDQIIERFNQLLKVI